jgi:hypothetical protein
MAAVEAICRQLLAPREGFANRDHLAEMSAQIGDVIVAAEPDLRNVSRPPKEQINISAVSTIVVDLIPTTGDRCERLRRTIDVVELVGDGVWIAID